jgi:myo-inositol-1(or 4)-monophosphatase
MKDNEAQGVIERIHEALDAAVRVLGPYVPGTVRAEYKPGGDPVTEADRAVDSALRKILVRSGEGWLSEESSDDLTRLTQNRIWLVDPLDGTREFLAAIPEWCVSVALAESGRAMAGGIVNPATGEMFLGSPATGLFYNGRKAQASSRTSLAGALVLASRSEVGRGEWDRFRNAPCQIHPMGSVAFKLARVAAGLADATWTLTPKHEWDVAAGVALVEAGGGVVKNLSASALTFNNRSPLVSGLLASGRALSDTIEYLISPHIVPELNIYGKRPQE